MINISVVNADFGNPKMNDKTRRAVKKDVQRRNKAPNFDNGRWWH
jgi:hypothetical protein